MILFLVIAALAILAVYFMLNKKEVEQEREGIVKGVLSKDSLSVDFDDGKSTVVKFFGITPATESEMMDEKIFALFDERLQGAKISVKPRSVGAGDVIVAEVRTLAGEYVNALLVRQGFARWSVVEASSETDLFDAQEKAKSEQLGVWNPAIRQLAEKDGSSDVGDDSDVEPKLEDEKSDKSTNPSEDEAKE